MRKIYPQCEENKAPQFQVGKWKHVRSYGGWVFLAHDTHFPSPLQKPHPKMIAKKEIINYPLIILINKIIFEVVDQINLPEEGLQFI